MSQPSLKFEDLELDLASYQLRRSGSVIKLERIPMELLILLAGRNGQLVSREEIIAKLWGKDVFVDSEHGVNTAIRKIRNALQDDSERPRFIETVVGKGYRFIAPIAVPPEPAKPQFHIWRFAWIGACVLLLLSGLGYLSFRYFATNGFLSSGRVMLAVLPFDNLTGDSTQDYFSDGLTEEMITQLARLDPRRLGVIARTSAMSYKHSSKSVDQIGRELGVNYILEGSTRREGGRVRITAQLIQVPDQSHVWVAEYDRDMQSVLQLQTEVADAIGNEIRLKLTPGSRPASPHVINPDAYEAYLKGRYFIEKWTEEGTRVGRQYFEQAIKIDPNYALAYAGLADSYVWGRVGLPPGEAFGLAKAAAIKALELDGTLGEPHATLAQLKFIYDWDWPVAEAEFKRSIELNPNDTNALHMYSHYLLSMARIDESLAVSKRALEHDPVSPTMQLHLGFHYLIARQYDLAIPQYLKVLQTEPSLPDAHNQLAVAYRQKGLLDQSVAQYLQVEILLGATPEQIASMKAAYARSGMRGFWLTVLTYAEGSDQIRISPYQIASYCAILDKKDESFEWLEKAYAAHDESLVAIKTDSDFDNLHADKRFTELLHRMRLPE